MPDFQTTFHKGTHSPVKPPFSLFIAASPTFSSAKNAAAFKAELVKAYTKVSGTGVEIYRHAKYRRALIVRSYAEGTKHGCSYFMIRSADTTDIPDALLTTLAAELGNATEL